MRMFTLTGPQNLRMNHAIAMGTSGWRSSQLATGIDVSLLSTFLIEGVLGSTKLHNKNGRECPKIFQALIRQPFWAP